MWTKEQIRSFTATKQFAVAVASAMSAVGGAAVGATIAMKRLETKYAQLAEKEIEEAKRFYEQKNKAGEYADPIELASKYENEIFADPDGSNEESDIDLQEAARKLASKLMYHAPTPDEDMKTSSVEVAEVKASISRNIFENQAPVEDDDFDLEKERENRPTNSPYIISHDEFYEGELDYNQITVTYFEKDEVLVDDADKPIPDIDNTIGDDNLRFGYGSKDNNVVYVRNDAFGVDFEVTRSFGSYSEEVLGFIEHSDKPRPRKFRNYD